MTRLFHIAQGSGSKVSIECKEDAKVPVRNVGTVAQIFGVTVINPGEVQWLPSTVARALATRPEFLIEWPRAADCKALQIQMHLGLGDNIFVLAACNAYHKEHPDVDIWFDAALPHKEWIEWAPFVKYGIAEQADVVNLTGIPQHGFDRASLIASILGITLDDIRFPIEVPRLSIVPEEPYWVFAPFCRGRSIRSFHRSIIDMVLSEVPTKATNGNIVLLDEKEYQTRVPCINLSGKTTLAEVWSLVQHSEGVIAVDTGVAWTAAALGKPALVFMGYYPANSLVMTMKTVWTVEPAAECYPCGDPGWPPKCAKERGKPLECMNYPPEMVVYKILEMMKCSSDQR